MNPIVVLAMAYFLVFIFFSLAEKKKKMDEKKMEFRRVGDSSLVTAVAITNDEILNIGGDEIAVPFPEGQNKVVFASVASLRPRFLGLKKIGKQKGCRLRMGSLIMVWDCAQQKWLSPKEGYPEIKDDLAYFKGLLQKELRREGLGEVTKSISAANDIQRGILSRIARGENVPSSVLIEHSVPMRIAAQMIAIRGTEIAGELFP